MAGSGKKEFKITINKEKEPELYKWVMSLNYGFFPKVVIEVLRWYEKNGLLVRGGIVSPDILIKQQNEPNDFSPNPFELSVLKKLERLEEILSKTDLTAMAVKSQVATDINESPHHKVQEVLSSDGCSDQLQSEEQPNEEPPAITMPASFRVFRFKNKGNEE